MKKYILIKADVNDGDYISSKNEITDEDIELIKPIIDAIKEYDNDKSIKRQKWNWDINGYNDQDPNQRYVKSGKCSLESFDYFNDLLPFMDNQDIHTIESIEILVVSEEIKLL